MKTSIELQSILLTTDGKGYVAKSAALNTLLENQFQAGKKEGWKEGMLEARILVNKEIDYCAAPTSHNDMLSAAQAILTSIQNKGK